MRRVGLELITAMGLVLAAPALWAAPPAPKDAQARPAVPERLETLLKSLQPEVGEISISPAQVKLMLGKDYYFLPASDAKRVLTEGWGNPPDAVTNVLGMVFPAGKSFLDETWGAVITFEATGYVTDDDAKSADYDSVLTQSRDSETQLNEERRKAGFAGQHIVGWAQPPSYDSGRHTLVWAREIKFDGEPVNTLNYDLRLLGRRGVLSLNMIAGMPQLGSVRSAATSFGQAVSFEQGARYADFDDSVDEKAGYGLAGLVATGVGVAAAKKLGLLAILLGFGKKFIILILAVGAGAIGWLRRRFGKDEAEI
jgi:uncharacterized membrane-anchored protein